MKPAVVCDFIHCIVTNHGVGILFPIVVHAAAVRSHGLSLAGVMDVFQIDVRNLAAAPGAGFDGNFAAHAFNGAVIKRHLGKHVLAVYRRGGKPIVRPLQAHSNFLARAGSRQPGTRIVGISGFSVFLPEPSSLIVTYKQGVSRVGIIQIHAETGGTGIRGGLERKLHISFVRLLTDCVVQENRRQGIAGGCFRAISIAGGRL